MSVSLRGKRVYVDANVAIYAVEAPGAFPKVKTAFVDPLDAGNLVAVTSELTLLKTLIKPRRSGDLVLERTYRDLLTKTSFEIRPIDAAVLERAIDLRLLGLKTPDAIHVATGMLERCDVFLTRDQDWKKAGVALVDPGELA